VKIPGLPAGKQFVTLIFEFCSVCDELLKFGERAFEYRAGFDSEYLLVNRCQLSVSRLERGTLSIKIPIEVLSLLNSSVNLVEQP